MEGHDKKALLLSVRMRFSPEAQPIRELAIEKIIEQNMILADATLGLSIKEIEQLLDIYLEKRLIIFGRKTIENAIQRLTKKRKLTFIKAEQGSVERYKLSDETLRECHTSIEFARQRNEKVINQLFSSVEISSAEYAKSFFECIEAIFSHIGEAYVRLLKGDIQPREILDMPAINHAIKHSINKNQKIDQKIFEVGIRRFLIEHDSDFDAIKWNMSQNYFIAKLIGLNTNDTLLSRELFADSVLYLDTNVIVNAVEPSARHHRSLVALFEACNKIGITLKVCRISIQELSRVVAQRKESIKRISSKIPTGLQKKIADLFYQIYIEKYKSGEDIDLNVIFSNFENAKTIMKENYNISEIDDTWFDRQTENPSTLTLANYIKTKSKKIRNRVKSVGSAVHDALMLEWIRDQRENHSVKTWLLTLDTSFPDEAIKDKTDYSKSIILTLDALIQWISPIAISDSMGEEVSTIFSEAIRTQLLPHDKVFGINDFLVFAGIEWDVKEMPAQDVENCLLYLRKHGPNLNPDDPVDREKIAHEIAKFFVDPARKYKAELSSLEQQINDERKSRNDNVEELSNQIIVKNKVISYYEERELKTSGKIRVLIAALPTIITEIVFTLLACTYGSGENIFLKVLSFWPYLVLGIALFPFAAWFIVGKKRLKALGGPFKKLSE